MFDYNIEIEGVAKDVLHQSMTITESVNGRNKMDISLMSPNGAYRADTGDRMTVEEEGVLIFAGDIETPFEKGFGDIGGPDIEQKLSVIDDNANAEYRHFTGDIPAGNVKQALELLIPYLEDITLHPSQVNGPNLPALHYDYVSVRKILDEITVLTNFTFVWDIDYLSRLRMFEPSGNPAPFNIATDDGNVIGDITVEPTQEEYANRIIFRYSSGAVAAYAFLRLEDNLVDGDEIVLGNQTYTFQDVLTDESGNVLIGATAADTLGNLNAAINHAGGGNYAPSTPLHTQVFSYIHDVWGYMVVKALAAGEAGNDIDSTSTNPDAVWYNEGNIERPTLWNGKDIETTEKIVVDDVAAQTARGKIIEKVITDTDVFDYNIALLKANAELARSVLTPKKIVYTTDQRNIHPGMTQTVTVPERNLSGTHIITDVVIKNITGGITRRTVTAYGGVSLPVLWQDYARRLFAGSAGDNSGGGSGGAIPGTGGGGTPISAGAGLTQTLQSFDVGPGDGIDVTDDTVTVKLDGTSLTKSPAGLRITNVRVPHEVPTGTVNSVNKLFSTAFPFTDLVVFLNGLKQELGYDYIVIDSDTFEFVFAPQQASGSTPADRVTVTYEHPV